MSVLTSAGRCAYSRCLWHVNTIVSLQSLDSFSSVFPATVLAACHTLHPFKIHVLAVEFKFYPRVDLSVIMINGVCDMGFERFTQGRGSFSPSCKQK